MHTALYIADETNDGTCRPALDGQNLLQVHLAGIAFEENARDRERKAAGLESDICRPDDGAEFSPKTPKCYKRQIRLEISKPALMPMVPPEEGPESLVTSFGGQDRAA